MRVVVPFDERRPKTRLSDTLGESERSGFARAMLGDVVAAVETAAGRGGVDVDRLTVLSTGSLPPLETLVEGTESGGSRVDREVVVDERDLTRAVNDVLAGEIEGESRADRRPGSDRENADAVESWPVAVVMADLALATPAAVARLLGDGGDGGPETVTLVPGRGGGTNAVLARHRDFRVDYHGASFRDHRRRAQDVGATLRRVDSYRLSTDIDEREDLPEVLLHGRPRSRSWLRQAGFELVVESGRVGVRRTA